MANEMEEQQISSDSSSNNGMMANESDLNKKTVNVAVAVIHHQEQYLLGFRSSVQHQGNRYEFVGGKIDHDETASVALIREVSEETGIDIQNNNQVKLGRLHHDYGDKQVCLQVYKVALTAEQYQQHQHCDYGLEGQALTWVDKKQLLAGYYPLPAANQTILSWLHLPEQITITYPLASFSESTDVAAAWCAYHQQHIAKEAWVYMRTKASELEPNVAQEKRVTDAELTVQLMSLRPDIYSVVGDNFNYNDGFTDQFLLKSDTLEIIQATPQSTKNTSSVSQRTDSDLNLNINSQIAAYHLTHHELMQWFNDYQAIGTDHNASAVKGSQPFSIKYQPSDLLLIVSCHDTQSIYAANELAAMRLQNKLPPVIGMFLSPVLATQSHPDSEPLGWQAWSTLAELADMPVIGLGGLSPLMIEQAAENGATSIAGIRQFLEC